MDKVLQRRFPVLFGLYLIVIFVVYWASQFLLSVIWPVTNISVGSISGGSSSAMALSTPPGFAFPIIFISLILIVALAVEKFIAKEKLSLHFASKMFLVLFVSLLFGGWVVSLFIFYLNDSFSAVILISSISSFVIQLILLLLAKYNLK